METNSDQLNIIEYPVTLPLTEDQLELWFDDIKSYYFTIDYENSSLTPIQFLNYIYNAGINCTLKPINDQDKLNQLVSAYVKYDRLVSIDYLNDVWCSIALSNDDRNNKFYQFDSQLVEQVRSLFYNFRLFLPLAVDSTIKTTDVFDSEFDRPTLFDINVISLRHSNLFWVLLQSLSNQHRDRIFYRKMFTELIFEGQSILGPFLTEFNPISIAYSLVAQDGSDNQANK